ncbi:MAG: isocitrate lyase/phosphoenolpyruvate mutase family protein [Litorimonas sp.]
MTRSGPARTFHDLHDPADPLVLYNAWDAATARACVAAGAKAVATGSHSVAEAHGFADGQHIPFAFLVQITERMAASVDVPLTVDFEGGYAEMPDALSDNLKRLVDAGAVGINFEDQRIGGDGLHPVEAQAGRIAVLRRAAEACGVDVFINARTDLFLKQPDNQMHESLLDDAVARAAAYREAGASGFFAPRLSADLIAPLAGAISLPLNVMAGPDGADIDAMARLGVARISHGPFPFMAAMHSFEEVARQALTRHT